MSAPSPDQATEQCMFELGLTGSPSYADVDLCQSGLEGQTLLHRLGLETNMLSPKLYFVPWVTINHVRNLVPYDHVTFFLNAFLILCFSVLD